MGQPPGTAAALLDKLRDHKVLRQTTALFVKNVLVAWRNRWATAIRLLAPLLFLALALVVQEVMGANARRTGRIRATPAVTPSAIGSIPGCHSELFIHDKPCVDFAFTPNDDETVRDIVAAIQRNNDPPIPDERVIGFSSRAEADDFIQRRQTYVLGAVHFSYSPTGQLQYLVQTNTTVPTFKGYVQGPNDFFQLPFMSAIAREIARHYLAAAGRDAEAAALQWSPRTSAFPHPRLSAGTAGYILPPFIFVACMFATISHLSMLVAEKESGLRQALQTMGLLQGPYWVSWWLFEAFMAAITAWCITGFGFALRLSMFTTNSVWLLFLLFWLFGMAMSSFACCVSVFMSTAQSASNAGLGIILAGWVCQALGVMGLPYSPSIFFTSNGMGKVFFWVFMLFPWNPLTKGVLDMSAAATQTEEPGLRFADRSSYCRYVPDPAKSAAGSMTWLYLQDNCILSIEQCYYALLAQAAAWMLAAVYLDNVRPNKHGVRLPPWYPLLPGYWANMCRAAAAALVGAGGGGGGTAGGARATSGGGRGRGKSPFAAGEANRKAARSMHEAKEEEGIVIRCTTASNPGSGAPDVLAKLPNGGAAAAGLASVGSAARHSVSSGFLRRRENRQSSSGAEHHGAAVAAAATATAAPGAVEMAGVRPGAAGAGKLTPQHTSQQLLVQNSVTVLRLSDASSDAAHSGVGLVGAAAGAATCVPGSTISLAQFQQQLQASARHGGAPGAPLGRRWWEFWRAAEAGHLAAAAKKHGAAAGAAQAKDAAGAVGAYGMVPVVLDPGVLQEEQRMKAAWYSDPSGCWTPKQDVVQVFGLRMVYRMQPPRRRWWWPFGSGGRRAQGAGGGGPQQPRPQQFVAVADSWFGVPKGQLLCLLGPNGAGKTTTINCLIGALPPTAGDIRVMGHSLLAPGGLEVAQAVMGVCPQFDVLWDELTGREHMYIYGCIKGLPAKEVTEQGAQLIEAVQLTAAAAKRSGSYSGGMKRRLSVALALLGRPQLVYLDEPSTGMDPISRRAVWDAINAAKSHAAIVLTTHSMEEADALGDRIGIMVRGRMRVLGGSLGLKQKYGNGYQLRMRLKDAQPGDEEELLLLRAAQEQEELRQLLPLAAARRGWLRPHSTGCELPLGGAPHRWALQPAASAPLAASGAVLGGTATPVPGTPSASAEATAGAGAGAGAAAAASSGEIAAASDDGAAAAAAAASSGSALQELVAQQLGLVPEEQGRRMLHYVIPQALAPQLQGLLELLDRPERQQDLGLAEVHVSLASLEEVFLAVVKQAEQDHAALHGHTVLVLVPETGQQLEVPVGQEAAVDPSTGEVYEVQWVQDEWGKLAVLGLRLMDAAQQQRYWQHRHVQQ